VSDNKECPFCSSDFDMNYTEWVRKILNKEYGSNCEFHEKLAKEPNPFLSMVKLELE
jgi:hypothetical protein